MGERGLNGKVEYEDAKKVIIFLCGSDHLSDWIANFFFRGEGGIHRQWERMVTLTADWLWKAISKAQANGKQVILVGYSMGGACAEIVATKMENVSDLKLYLFGAPKGLNRRNQDELYNRVSVFRFYNRGDIVPRLPLRWHQSKKCVRIFLPKRGHKWENYRERYEELLRDLKEAKVSAY